MNPPIETGPTLTAGPPAEAGPFLVIDMDGHIERGLTRAGAESFIDGELEDACDWDEGWPDGIDGVGYGVMLFEVVETNRREPACPYCEASVGQSHAENCDSYDAAEPEKPYQSDVDYYCAYEVHAVPRAVEVVLELATDEQLRAELRRRAVTSNGDPDAADWKAALEGLGCKRNERGDSWWLDELEAVWRGVGEKWYGDQTGRSVDYIGPYDTEEQAARAWLRARREASGG